MPLLRRSSESIAEERQSGSVDSELSSGSPDKRWSAARAISARADGTQALAKALANENDARVREAIFTGLARIATPESALAALPYLRSDDATLRTAALDCLRAMPRAVKPHLEALLGDHESDVRLLACEIVRSLNEIETTRLLCALLEVENSSNVCAAAIDVLSEVGNAEALPYLKRCAARFTEVPFISFAIDVASDRLRAQV
jgi:HEAT repeat protein